MSEAQTPASADVERAQQGHARNTALFSVATGFSRIAGLLREVLAAALLGINGVANAYVTALIVPNLVRSFVADAALGAAFIPVFNQLLHDDEEERAWRVASTVMTIALVGLSLLTILCMTFIGPILATFKLEYPTLTQQLALIVFPTVVLLGLSGVINAMLNSFGEFFVPAIAPVLWNIVIVAFLIGAFFVSSPAERVSIYAWGTLAGTVVQFVFPLPWLRGRGGRLRPSWAVRDPLVARVFILMLPVTIGLGLINVNAFVDVTFAGWVNPDQAPAAIDKAFRIYMLPQGVFSVAVAAVLFPTLSRLVAAGDMTRFRAQVAEGLRTIHFLLWPAAIATCVFAAPIVRILFRHGAFSESQVGPVAASIAAFSLGLAANGGILLLNRSFFSLQRPWLPTAVALANVGLNILLDWLLYKPFGVWGIPLATSLGNIAFTVVLWFLLRRQVGPLEGRATLIQLAQVLAASAVMALAGFAVYWPIRELLGLGLLAQLAALLPALAVSLAAFYAAAKALRIPEVATASGLVRRRLGR